MRYPKIVASAIMMSIAVTTNAMAVYSVYTDTRNKCSVISKESTGRVWRCKGPAGFSAVFSDEGNVVEVQFGPTGAEKNLGHLQWPGAGEAIGPRVEWRLSGGKPIAAILRVIMLDENGRASPHLLIAKVTTEGGCLIEAIDARSRGANVRAREIADERASTYKCRQ